MKVINKVKRIIKKVNKSSKISNLPILNLPFKYSVDSPNASKIYEKTVNIEGWLIPDKGIDVKSLRISLDGNYQKLDYKKKRLDVAKAYPDSINALYSGFSSTVKTKGGKLDIEVDWGKGFQTIFSTNLEYLPEKLVKDYYNPSLAENMAEHLNLNDNKNKYFYEESNNFVYTYHRDDPRLIAFYLPQFHPIAENDQTWGKGFTEWTNVTNDTPRFVGHQQPILPKDTGFYDLRLEQNLEDQINTAKEHGIYGFCFYYYWFSGKKILDKPLKSFLKHKDWNYNFSICWANENWTKKWDGKDNEVIIAQEYNKEDPLKFIKDVEGILMDPRYIRENNKPILIVFRASELKDPKNYSEVWRNYMREKHKTELHLVSIVSFDDTDPRTYGFDMALDFAPQSSFFKNDSFSNKLYPFINVNEKLLDINFKGDVADYRAIALNDTTYNYFGFPSYKCVTPSWDNDARKKGKGFVMYNQSPDIYAEWLNNIMELEKHKKSSLIFINAWNEWAEGAVLEPTQHFGSAVLNRTTEVLARHSFNKKNKALKIFNIDRNNSTDIAVILHLYYPEQWDFINEKLDYITEDFDLFVTINIKDIDFKETIRNAFPNAYIYIVPNRGRDVLPFLHLAHRLDIVGYKYILKLHSKKSIHRIDGNDWFNDVVNKLLPSKEVVNELITKFKNNDLNMVGPKDHLVSLHRHMGSNKKYLKTLLEDIYNSEQATKIIKNDNKYNYFGGTMFWVSVSCIKPILDLHLLPEDFDSEKNQIDGTKAHAIERLFGVVTLHNGYKLNIISSLGVQEAKLVEADQKYKFAP